MSARRIVFVSLVGAVVFVAAIVGTHFAGERASLKRARTEISMLRKALDSYYRDNDHYPSTEAGLQALFIEPGLKAATASPPLLDPWGNPYIYRSTAKAFVLKSLGADGAEGGRGANADVEIGVGETSHNTDFDP
jgi:general secretion pathway protein G